MARFRYRGEYAVQIGRSEADDTRSEYLNMERQWHDRSPYVNQSLFNPEWVYGVGVTSHTSSSLTNNIR